jgi:predicted AlkP superfamily pyrophosphatase or phosphodiesterase
MKMILYFSDAFAWRYVEDTDYMADFWDARRPLRTILGYSSTILPVLITGKRPQETGIWTEYFRSQRRQSRLARWVSRFAFLRTPVNMARLVLFRFARKAGSPTAHRLRIPIQISHFFGRHDMDYRNFPPVDLPHPTIDRVVENLGLRFSFRYMPEHVDVDEELARLAGQLDDYDVFFFYDPSVDGRGHHVGASATALAPELAKIEQFLHQAAELIGHRSEEAEFILFSDHGMTNVERTFDIFAALGNLRAGRDYLVWVDSTFARFWYPSEEMRATVHERLRTAPAQFLTQEEIEAYGIDFPDDRYGQDVFVIDEGAVFHPSYISPSFFRTKNFPDKAMHGYRPEALSASGVFCYRGRRLDSELPEQVPAESVFGIVKGIAERSVRVPR